MKAAIYHDIKNISIDDIPDPVCGDNDVVIKNLYAGICGSDKSAYSDGGDKVLIWKNSEFGHETVSEVVEVGKCVEGFKVGDRVYPEPSSCKGDLMRASTIGAFSEKILVLDARLNGNLYKVPESIPLKVATLIEPLSVGFYTARRAQPRLGETAVVFGPGIIGAGTALSLRARGVEKILIVGTSDFRLNLLQQYGFEVCNLNKEALSDQLAQCFGLKQDNFGLKANIDIWVDAAGAQSVLEAFTEQGKHGSRMVVTAIHHIPRSIDMQKLTLNDQTIIGSAGYDDVANVIDFLTSTEYPLVNLVTQEFPLESIERAIVTAGNSDQSLKVLIRHNF